MDVSYAREARQRTCRECVWFATTVTVSGAQHYGECRVDPPRATGRSQFPIVMQDRWCSAWLPVCDARMA